MKGFPSERQAPLIAVAGAFIFKTAWQLERFLDRSLITT